MNVIEYKSTNTSIVFCLVDNTVAVQDTWAKEIAKNISDYTISTLYGKGYSVLQGLDEDQLLQQAMKKYQYAVVISTGTEFINGDRFFESLHDIVNNDFVLCGHVLDRGDAYYELHSQCYLLNLKKYKKIGCPAIGQQELGSPHVSNRPWRSNKNFHGTHTPTWIAGGEDSKIYNHKCHGWNILRTVFDLDLKVLIWDEISRSGKRYNYPENTKDFLKQSQWLYHRERFCSNNFVHGKNTEHSNGLNSQYTQMLIPASGALYLDQLDTTKQCIVYVYDYNNNALDYWKDQFVSSDSVVYKFINLDLLGEEIDITFLDSTQETLINVSNIFCYEGTCAFSPLKYRLFKENQLLSNLQKHIPEAHVNFSMRAASGFVPCDLAGKAKHLDTIDINLLKKPTWHVNQDWI